MLEIRPARTGEEGLWRPLWQRVFGDGEALLERFSACCPNEEILLLLKDGRLQSMLAVPPVEVALANGETATGAYVYALATAPESRACGYGRQLLRWTDGYLTRRGIQCVTVVPAQPSLHAFFGSVGFQPCFSTCTVALDRDSLPAPMAGVVEIGPREYNSLRHSLLVGREAVHYPDRLIAFQQTLSGLSGAGLYRVDLDGTAGCAAAEYGADGLICKELLAPPTHLATAAAALLARLPARRCSVRLPVGWGALPGETRPFGMIKWLTPPGGLHGVGEMPAYMGLGFD